MTAEVALLNKSAVALAADSAMTLVGVGKIYPTNKLFALSNYNPVGIMIYNNTEFMGVPWETLIKKYRSSIGSESKETIRQYVAHFMGGINTMGVPWETLIKKYRSSIGSESKETIRQYVAHFMGGINTSGVSSDEQQETNLFRIARDNFATIRDVAHEELNNIIRSKKRFSTRDESRVIRKATEGRLRKLTTSGELTSMEDVNATEILSNYRDKIDEQITQVFGGFNISKSTRRLLHRVFRLAIKSNEFSRGNSGIVVAGFGENEMFPTLVVVITDGMVGGKLKYHIRHHIDIERNGASAAIVPFAQTEMVQRFMEGVDPEFLHYLRYSMKELLFEFGKEIPDVHGLANNTRLDGLRKAVTTQMDDYLDTHATRFRKNHFVDPVIQAVEYLPKEELASMAEALVNLTSLKRRVSLEQETVGGPIDSAVISKGDGFVWIKRKHYFEAALNASYFHRQSNKPTKGESNDS